MKAMRRNSGIRKKNMIKTNKAKELQGKIEELEEEVRKLEVIIDWLWTELVKERGEV